MVNLFGKNRELPVHDSSESDPAVTVFSALSIPICILDETNRIQYGNGAMSSHFGKISSEINGKYFSQVVDKNCFVAEPGYVEKMKQSGSAVTEIVEIRGRWFEITVCPLAGLSGAVRRRTVQLTREIPGAGAIDREVVSKHLQKTHRSIIGAVSSDLLNRVASITGYMQLIERKGDDPDKRARYLKCAFEALESLLELIKELRETRVNPEAIE